MITVIQNALDKGLIPGVIIIGYVIINKFLDNKRDENQIKNSNELAKTLNTISLFIQDITKNIIENDREKNKAAIRDSLTSSCNRLSIFCIKTIINNNIKSNKENIINNIENIVKTEYYATYCTLGLYTVNDNRVCDYMKTEWMKDVNEVMVKIIFDENLSHDDRIVSVINRLDNLFSTFITYLMNNSSNNYGH